jgi:ADP-heptose:LPS heptosyltransferase
VLAIRAPDHLGDAVMALPAVRALAEAGPTRVHTRGRWGRELYAGLEVRPGDERPEADVGVLFKPSVAAALRWLHLPRRVGVGRRLLLTDPVPAGGHRREEYARVAAVLGATGLGMPVYTPRGQATPLPPGTVGLNPWSPTATVRWARFRALADALGRVVFFAGPGEAEAVRALAGPHPVLVGLSLPDFAATLEGCRAFVSNDSGAAHFAAACSVPVVMLHGSTDPALTGVGRPVVGPPVDCGPCYRKTCSRGLACLEIEVAQVMGALP